MKQNIILVSETIYEGCIKKGGWRKMVSPGFLVNKTKLEAKVVNSCLDKLIKTKYVRYYDTENKSRFFGFTKLGFEKFELFKQPMATQTKLPQAANVVQTKTASVDKSKYVACKYCNKLYKKRGIKLHERACRMKTE